MKQRVLIVEDDLLLAHTLDRVLKNHQYVTKIASKLETGISLLEQNEYQLVVLDLNLPDGSGYQLLQFLTKYAPTIKVIIVTGNNDLENRIKSFDYGSADFMAKPCNLDEFLVRVNRLTRWKIMPKESQLLKIKDIHIMPDSGQIFVKGKEILLRRREFQILECLAHHQNRIVTTHELLTYVWGVQKLPVDNTIQVYMSKLRSVLGENLPIKTVRGMGYRVIG